MFAHARTLALGLAIGVAALAPASAPAVPILYSVSAVDDGLSIIDPTTGAVTFVGALSPPPGPNEFPVPTSLARDPQTGVLYTWNNQSGLNGLVAIDTATGAGTLVAPGAPSPLQNFSSIASAPNGTLYGVSGGLFRIDKTSSQLTEINPGNFLPDMSGADFGPDGLLYGTTSAGNLFLDISLADASWTQTVDMILEDGTRFGGSQGLSAQIQSIAFHPGGDLLGSAFIFERDIEIVYDVDPSGLLVTLDGQPPGEAGSAVDASTGTEFFFSAGGVILFAVDADGNLVPGAVPQNATLTQTVTAPSRTVLFDVELATGVVSNLRDVSGPLPQGLAFVPEPSTAALLSLGLVGLAAARRRSA